MNVDQRVPRLVKSEKKNYKGKRKNNNSLKVVYISSPMKVKTSALRFRSLVQQLTGKNSDISQCMDDNNNYMARDFHEDHELLAKETSNDRYQYLSSSISPEDTPTSSDSFLGPMDKVFMSQMKEQLLFEGMFSSSDSFYHASQMDVLGSFDDSL